jgi:hypothetical protein
MGSGSDESSHWILNNRSYTELTQFQDCYNYKTQPIITLSKYNKVFNTTVGIVLSFGLYQLWVSCLHLRKLCHSVKR